MPRIAIDTRLSWITLFLPLVLDACVALPPGAPALHKSADYVLDEHIGQPAPQIGLALSGGGQKSAPFEMGVLAALSQTGVLNSIDVISSVSGGSYAALYYYTRVAERYGNYVGANQMDRSPFADVFLDCLPRKLDVDFSDTFPWDSTDRTGLCPGSDPARNYWVPNDPELQRDPLRFASQVRASQALFAIGWAYRDRTKFPIVIGPILQEFAFGIWNTLIAGPIRLITDSVFDWNLKPSAEFWLEPGKWLYDRGIKRAYGATATREPTETKGRPHGSELTVDHLTFSDLKDIYLQSRQPNCKGGANGYQPCHVPLWVINTTAGTSISPFLLTEPERFTGAQNTFEFSPFGYGSGAYGYAKWKDKQYPNLLQPDMRVVTAVGASAAFFDSQQRTVGGLFNPMLNVLLRWLNFDWGTSIPNYNLGRSLYKHARIFHDFLPWPLYLLHRHRGNAEALRIHLSDGGMSEDLGVWALLRRHVSQIIVVDAASDSDYQLDDLCQLYLQLSTAQNRPLFIVFESPKLSRFAAVCEQEQFHKAGNDPFGFKVRGDWPRPVLKAWVCDGVPRRGSKPGCGSHHTVATLYIIKPMLNWTAHPQGGYALKDTIAFDGAPIPEKRCSIPDTKVPGDGYPCEVLTYLSSSGYRNSKFPQESTVWLSALSSPYIYGAYRDLGLYYAKALRILNAGGTNPQVDIDDSHYWNNDSKKAP